MTSDHLTSLTNLTAIQRKTLAAIEDGHRNAFELSEHLDITQSAARGRAKILTAKGLVDTGWASNGEDRDYHSYELSNLGMNLIEKEDDAKDDAPITDACASCGDPTKNKTQPARSRSWSHKRICDKCIAKAESGADVDNSGSGPQDGDVETFAEGTLGDDVETEHETIERMVRDEKDRCVGCGGTTDLVETNETDNDGNVLMSCGPCDTKATETKTIKFWDMETIRGQCSSWNRCRNCTQDYAGHGIGSPEANAARVPNVRRHLVCRVLFMGCAACGDEIPKERFGTDKSAKAGRYCSWSCMNHRENQIRQANDTGEGQESVAKTTTCDCPPCHGGKPEWCFESIAAQNFFAGKDV